MNNISGIDKLSVLLGGESHTHTHADTHTHTHTHTHTPRPFVSISTFPNHFFSPSILLFFLSRYEIFVCVCEYFLMKRVSSPTAIVPPSPPLPPSPLKMGLNRNRRLIPAILQFHWIRRATL